MFKLDNKLSQNQVFSPLCLLPSIYLIKVLKLLCCLEFEAYKANVLDVHRQMKLKRKIKSSRVKGARNGHPQLFFSYN